MTGHAVVLRGDAAHLPLPDASVDLVLCSPPYFGLRSYSDAGQHYDGQIGSEATPREYLDALLACTREWVRVLKPSGSLFVNLGDKYVADNRGSGINVKRGQAKHAPAGPAGYVGRDMAKHKSLLGLPWRYAIACMDETAPQYRADFLDGLLGDVFDGTITHESARRQLAEFDASPKSKGLGLILRRDIIWHKCLSGGARVYARTLTGDRPVMLRDLARAYQPENVQFWNGQRWTQVLGWERTPDRDGALELELRTGERIGCTPEHRWPTQRGVIRSDEIRVGDIIQTTRLPEPETPATPRALPLEDIGWLVGLYLAEGSRSEKMLQFAGHVREDARHTRLKRIAEMYHGSATVYQTSENGVTCNVSGAILAGIIDHYIGRGRTAKTKRLRKTAWQRQDVFLRALVDGYLEGDGHYDAKNDRWRLGFTANDEWAADLRTLAARLGAKLSLRRSVGTLNGQRFPGWRGEWRWTRSARHNAKQDGEVVAIRVSRAREFYDVTVADDPHLFALASGVLTHNSNGLPESVTDRCRSSHEYLFHMVKLPRYYAAVDEIREGYAPGTAERYRSGYKTNSRGAAGASSSGVLLNMAAGDGGPDAVNPLGKLPGSVWTIPSSPLVVPEHLGVDHFAAYPPELVRRVVLGWSPPGVCVACGEGRRPVADVTRVPHWKGGHMGRHTVGGKDGTDDSGRARTNPVYEITGYACACTPLTDHPGTGESSGRPYRWDIIAGRYAETAMGPGRAGLIPPPTKPAIVLDPFAGTGTTMLVASAYGRLGVGVDRSADYCRLARWRVRDPGERARALGVAKPPPVPDGQTALFDLDVS